MSIVIVQPTKASVRFRDIADTTLMSGMGAKADIRMIRARVLAYLVMFIFIIITSIGENLALNNSTCASLAADWAQSPRPLLLNG
ncbi:hypothetical protein [Parasphingorhabdus sp.]|uniref:hypothetical protein n=1 Tax=Parasphingorhabdus sp. TaxID=2709688 RepID=UPI003BAE8061